MNATEQGGHGGAPTPAESRVMIDRTVRHARHAFEFSDAPLYVVWGVAWVALFAAFQLIAAPAYAPLSAAPLWVANVVGVAAIGGAAVFSGVHGARQGQGIGGTSERMGRRIAIGWVVAMSATGVIAGLMGLSGPLVGALFVFTVAVMYLGQGAVLTDDLMFGTGVWLVVATLAALLAGRALFSLVGAVLGGGGLLVAGVLARRRAMEATRGG